MLVGVGVSNAEQAQQACAVADGVVQGASVVRRLMEHGPGRRRRVRRRGARGDRRAGRDALSRSDCELCEAARLTEWFHEDDECWIAECESCSVPMVVWRVHDPYRPTTSRRGCTPRLAAVVAAHFEAEHYVDDNLRTIPTHYHAHARPRGGPFGGGMRRRAVAARDVRCCRRVEPLPPPPPPPPSEPLGQPPRHASRLRGRAWRSARSRHDGLRTAASILFWCATAATALLVAATFYRRATFGNVRDGDVPVDDLRRPPTGSSAAPCSCSSCWRWPR